MARLLLLPLLFALAAAQQCGKPSITPRDNKIVGGETAIKNSWPWQIHLGYKQTIFFFTSWSFICGGTIIDNKWVVTAAHCVESDMTAGNYKVRVGQHDSSISESTAKEYTVKRIIKHPSYNSRTTDNDIALLELSTSIAYTTAVSQACLPAANSDPASNTQVVTTGWGETSAYGKEPWSLIPQRPSNRAISSVLRQVKLNVVARSTCNSRSYYNNKITDNMVCAGITGKDACQGDSGGPLVSKNSAGNYELVGVVSWGQGCGAAQKPGVFTRVGKFVSWIKTNAGL